MARILLLCVLTAFSAPLLADTETEITTLLDYFAEMWNQEDTDFLSSYFHFFNLLSYFISLFNINIYF